MVNTINFHFHQLFQTLKQKLTLVQSIFLNGFQSKFETPNLDGGR